LPNGVDTSGFHAASPSERSSLRQDLWAWTPEHRVIGFVGRLDDQFKGISFLLRGIAQLRPAIPEIRLAIVGEGKDKPFLEKICKDLSLSDVVRFMGPRSDVERLYPLFDVLALLSLSEGF